MPLHRGNALAAMPVLVLALSWLPGGTGLAARPVPATGHAPAMRISRQRVGDAVAVVDGGDAASTVDPSRRRFMHAAAATSVLAAVGLPAAASAAAAPSAPQRPPDAPVVLSQLQESISGLVSGSAVSTSKVLVKHPLDTVSVRMQMQPTISRRKLWDGVFTGLLPPLLFAAPSGSVFFGVKDGVKAACKSGSLFGVKLSRSEATLVGVFAAQFPYWAIRNPSEVIKTRAQVGDADGVSTLDAARQVVREEGWQALWLGYGENIAYAFPADALKFGIYEFLAGGRSKTSIPPLEGAVLGAFATACAQALTTPLDVVRNRVMANVPAVNSDEAAAPAVPASPFDYARTLKDIWRLEGAQGLFAGTTPRVGKAALSGAVQFGIYEVTKGSMSKYFGRQQSAKTG